MFENGTGYQARPLQTMMTPSEDINNREDLVCAIVFCEVGSGVRR
jgi:hypothetical protein